MSLRPGYAYLLEGRSDWKRAPNSDWETTMTTDNDHAQNSFLGTRSIDGRECEVFLATKGKPRYLAQPKEEK